MLLHACLMQMRSCGSCAHRYFLVFAHFAAICMRARPFPSCACARRTPRHGHQPASQPATLWQFKFSLVIYNFWYVARMLKPLLLLRQLLAAAAAQARLYINFSYFPCFCYHCCCALVVFSAFLHSHRI